MGSVGHLEVLGLDIKLMFDDILYRSAENTYRG